MVRCSTARFRASVGWSSSHRILTALKYVASGRPHLSWPPHTLHGSAAVSISGRPPAYVCASLLGVADLEVAAVAADALRKLVHRLCRPLVQPHCHIGDWAATKSSDAGLHVCY